jgi:uncharacterized lipoprotein YajG
MLNTQGTFNQPKVGVVATLEIHHCSGGFIMKKFFAPTATALMLTTSLLAGCASLLGDINIGENVLPVNGQKVDLTFPAATTATSFKAQAVATVSAVKEVTKEFDDIDASKIPATIAKVLQDIGITSVELTGTGVGCGANSPNTVAVTINELSAKVTDATTKSLSSKISGSFTATKAAGTYTVSNIVLNPAPVLSLTGDGAVLTGGGKNTLTIKLDASATSDPSLASCTLTITLKGGTTKVGLQ